MKYLVDNLKVLLFLFKPVFVAKSSVETKCSYFLFILKRCITSSPTFFPSSLPISQEYL